MPPAQLAMPMEMVLLCTMRCCLRVLQVDKVPYLPPPPLPCCGWQTPGSCPGPRT